MAFTEQSKGGKKGKAGRKSAPVEFAKAQAIIKAWDKVVKELEKEDVSVKDIALPMVLKDMANKIANADGSNLQLKTLLVKFLDGKNNNNGDSERVQETV